MIPVIYEKDETAFTSNGLGRLRDIISCTVTEERNGIYECDFEYATTGANYDLIKLGRIIAVTHDDTGDLQPFDIVSYSKPIDNIVSFHCVHISYRQSYITVGKTNGWGNRPNGGGAAGWQLPINSLEDALTMFTGSFPSNPFNYFTDKTSNGYLASADGTPRTVKELMGGIEGSILDTYGGEFEYDKFNVYLHSARGQLRDFTIRYGVNMTDYTDETDTEGTYSQCIPYWTDGTDFVVGDMQTKGSTITGRGECVPLDVSDKFEDKPTKAQVESAGLVAMNGAAPVQNIKVSFIRLQDMEEYAGLNNLLTCKLCDTITVIFPDYNASGQFKIVKTIWDVLNNRYEEMELGELQTTLAEALGVSNGLTRTPDNDLPIDKWDDITSKCSLSKSGGNSNATSLTVYKRNGFIHIQYTLKLTAAVSAGSNAWTGTLTLPTGVTVLRTVLSNFTSGKIQMTVFNPNGSNPASVTTRQLTAGANNEEYIITGIIAVLD